VSVLFEFPENGTEFFLYFIRNSPANTLYGIHWVPNLVNHMTCWTHLGVGAELFLDQTVNKY